MSWFEKKSEKTEGKIPELPSLPEIPMLPSLPPFSHQKEEIHQLPSLPRTSMGQRFSQNVIKEAVTGKEEEEESLDEFERENARTMTHAPFQKVPETPQRRFIPREFEEPEAIVRANEPVFIRLDKFEESLKLFDKTKEKIEEIERMLIKINRIRDEEEKELVYWEQEIKSIKSQLQKIDKEIFSKVE